MPFLTFPYHLNSILYLPPTLPPTSLRSSFRPLLPQLFFLSFHATKTFSNHFPSLLYLPLTSIRFSFRSLLPQLSFMSFHHFFRLFPLIPFPLSHSYSPPLTPLFLPPSPPAAVIPAPSVTFTILFLPLPSYFLSLTPCHSPTPPSHFSDPLSPPDVVIPATSVTSTILFLPLTSYFLSLTPSVSYSSHSSIPTSPLVSVIPAPSGTSTMLFLPLPSPFLFPSFLLTCQFLPHDPTPPSLSSSSCQSCHPVTRSMLSITVFSLTLSLPTLFSSPTLSHYPTPPFISSRYFIPVPQSLLP